MLKAGKYKTTTQLFMGAPYLIRNQESPQVAGGFRNG